MNVVEVSNVSKGFNEQEVLTGCSLAVKQGEIYGLLGANGAGKNNFTIQSYFKRNRAAGSPCRNSGGRRKMRLINLELKRNNFRFP